MSLGLYLSAFQNTKLFPAPKKSRIHRIGKPGEDTEVLPRLPANQMTKKESSAFKYSLAFYVAEKGPCKTADVWAWANKNVHRCTESNVLYHLNTLEDSGAIKNITPGRNKSATWVKL